MGESHNTSSGFSFVNVGMDAIPTGKTPRDTATYNRYWPLCREYGYLCAGGGKVYVRPIYALSPGDRVFAYQARHGYVGYGIVNADATPAFNFITRSGKRLPDAIDLPRLNHHEAPSELLEHAIGIDWIKTYTLEEAQWQPGLYAGRLTACRLNHPATLTFLREVFGVDHSTLPR